MPAARLAFSGAPLPCDHWRRSIRLCSAAEVQVNVEYKPEYCLVNLKAYVLHWSAQGKLIQHWRVHFLALWHA